MKKYLIITITLLLSVNTQAQNTLKGLSDWSFDTNKVLNSTQKAAEKSITHPHIDDYTLSALPNIERKRKLTPEEEASQKAEDFTNRLQAEGKKPRTSVPATSFQGDKDKYPLQYPGQTNTELEKEYSKNQIPISIYIIAIISIIIAIPIIFIITLYYKHKNKPTEKEVNTIAENHIDTIEKVDVISKLKDLSNLRETNVINEEEFTLIKNALLDKNIS